MKYSTLMSAIASSLLVAETLGHGYLSIPPSRGAPDVFADTDNSGTCGYPQVGQVTEYAAGQEIDVEWTRNNHLGGFIRFSMVPRDAVSKENFDQSTFYYTCREVNCTLKQCNDKMCADDPGSADHEIKCGTKIKLPDYLEAGDYVMQWTWFAAGSSYGNIGWSTGNYKSCADIRLTTSGTGSKPACPTFVGGDRVTNNFADEPHPNQCFYFDDNDLSTQIVELSDEEGLARYTYGVPKQIEQCGGGAGGDATPAPSAEPTSAPEPVGPPSEGTPAPSDEPAPWSEEPVPSSDAPVPSSEGEDSWTPEEGEGEGEGEGGDSWTPEDGEGEGEGGDSWTPEEGEGGGEGEGEGGNSWTPEKGEGGDSWAPGKGKGEGDHESNHGEYVYIGRGRHRHWHMNKWCNENCPEFCPSDACAKA